MANGIVNTAMLKRGGPRLVEALNNQSYLQHPWQKVLYVQSTHTRAVDGNNAGTSPDAPLKTLVKAVSLAAAGDMILVGPGHVETVITAAGLDFSKNYLTVVGCGHDAQRPVINVGGVIGAYWQISGTGVRMVNFTMTPTLDAVTKMLNISGPGVQLVDFRIDEASTFESVVAILVAATASRGKISRLISEQLTAGATCCIEIGGALTEFEITDCQLVGNYSGGNIKVSAAALHLFISRNKIHNLNTTIGIICGAVAASGVVSYNEIHITGALAAPFAAAITVGSAIWRLNQNYCTDAGADITGALIGTAAT